MEPLDIKQIIIDNCIVRSYHYLDRYVKFISNVSSTSNTKHVHHILPKAVFNEYADLKVYPNNALCVTHREHFICHWLLWKAIDNQSTTFAFYAMRHRNRMKINSRVYDALLSDVSDRLSELNSNRKWVNNGSLSKLVDGDHVDEYLLNGWVLGRVVTAEHRANISKARKGKPTGRTITPEHRARINIGRRCRDTSGSNNPNAKRFVYKNVCYLTLKDAQQHTGISRYILLKVGHFIT